MLRKVSWHGPHACLLDSPVRVSGEMVRRFGWVNGVIVQSRSEDLKVILFWFGKAVVSSVAL